MVGMSAWQRLWRGERGVTLIETIATVFLVGTVVVGVMQIMGVTARGAARSDANIDLLQIVRAQIETIQHAPFEENAEDYPEIGNIPSGFAISWAAVDPGTTYTYPPPDGRTLTNVVQKITVTAEGDNSSLEITFYKIKVP